jgi:hypothetical protein
VLALLATASREHGQSIAMVTHDPIAAAHADRVLFLGDGRIVADGLLRPWHLGQIDIDLVNAAILDLRRNRAHGILEHPRILAVGIKIRRQQQCVGSELCRFHQTHPRKHAQRAGFVGGRRNHAAAGITAQRSERPGLRFTLRHPPAAADHHRLAAQMRISQQLDRCVKRVHVEMGDVTRRAGLRCGFHIAVGTILTADDKRLLFSV